MKKSLLLCSGILTISLLFAQEDTSINGRITAFMNVTKELNMEKIMDYTYPKLFTIVPREQMIATMEKAFDSDEIKIRLDSLRIDSIYPVFQLPEGKFAKIRYSMTMILKLKEAEIDSSRESKAEFMQQIMSAKYGQGNFRYDKVNNQYFISVSTEMAAIKDSFAKEWSFINLKKDDPMMEMLLSIEVLKILDRFK